MGTYDVANDSTKQEKPGRSHLPCRAVKGELQHPHGEDTARALRRQLV